MKITKFENLVYNKLKEVPKGKVTTYAYLAKAVARPRAVRAVGNALNKNPFAPEVPCHRVVKSDGKIGGFASGPGKKKALLQSEGLNVVGEKVDLEKNLYNFEVQIR